MTDKEIYKKELLKRYEDSHCSMENAIIWIFTHHDKLSGRFINARRELSDEQRNEVIKDICLGGNIK